MKLDYQKFRRIYECWCRWEFQIPSINQSLQYSKHVRLISLIWNNSMNSFSICAWIWENGALKTITYFCREIEDEPSIGCGENVNKMHYNPHFDFEEIIWEHLNDSTIILDLFGASAGNEIYDSAKRDSRYQVFLSHSNTLPTCIRTPPISCIQNTSQFLHTYRRHLSFAKMVLVSLNNHVLQHIHSITWNWTQSTIIVLLGCTPSPWSSLHYSLHKDYQYIIVTKINNQLFKIL